MTTNYDVIFELNEGYTLVDVANEVNQLWGTAAQDPGATQTECLLPSINTPTVVFGGKEYARARMPEEYARALQDLVDGDERFGGYTPQSATVKDIQWEGPQSYLLGEAPILDEGGNPILIDLFDGDGNVVGQAEAKVPVYVGEIA